MKLLLTRHGETNWNKEGKIQGITDIELNDNGREKAIKTSDKLKDEEIDLILSSPLKRARETAEIISKNNNIPIIICDELKERTFGNFEGKTKYDFNFKEIFNYKLNVNYEGIESMGDLFHRVHGFIEKIKDEYGEKNILLVTHGGVAVAVRIYFEGIPEGMEVIEGFGIKNCEVIKYEI